MEVDPLCVDAGDVGDLRRDGAPALADPVDREIACHSNHPRPGIRRDLVPAHVRARQRLLSDVLGLAPVAEHDVGHAVGPDPEALELDVEVVHEIPRQRTPGCRRALTRLTRIFSVRPGQLGSPDGREPRRELLE